MTPPSVRVAARLDLWQTLLVDARSSTSTPRFWVDGGYQPITWQQLAADADRMTAGLRAAGVRPGTRVAAVLTNHPDTVRGLIASWQCGAAVASLPVRVSGMAATEYAAQLARICDQLDPVLLLAPGAVIESLPESVRTAVRATAIESFADSGSVSPSPPGADETAFIQFSSGSTSAPKGCVLTSAAIAHHLDMLSTWMRSTPSDVGVCWLPWSHDMGFFGGLLSGWWSDVATYFSTPQRFLMSPRTWFEDVARYNANYTSGSPTALHVASRVAPRSTLGPESLAQLRSVIIGAERVQWDVLRGAVEKLGPFGLREDALMPAYGLAEGTLAVTMTPLGEPPRYLSMDSIELADGRLRDVDPTHPHATKVVAAGRICPGAELVGADEDRLGPIRIRSASLAVGYYGDAERTRERFTGDVLDTHDLGFVRDGYLYPVGRADDMVSLGGRNVYLREIESAVEAIEGLRYGCSTLVAGDDAGRSRLTLLLEVGGRAKFDHAALAREAAAVAMAKGAVSLDECVFLRRNALPRTPSGKIQRHRCKKLLDTGGFEPLSRVDLA